MALIESKGVRLGAFLAGLAITVGFAAFMTVSMKHYLERPSNGEWKTVHEFVARQKSEGDVLAFYPAWLAGYARDWHRFEDLAGVSKQELLRPERLPAERVWVLSAFGDFHEDTLRSLGYTQAQRRRIGKVDVYLFVLPGRTISYRLSDRLASAVLKLERPGETVTLPWLGDRFQEQQGPSIQAAWDQFRYARRKGVRVPATKNAAATFDLGTIPEGKLVACGWISDQGLYTLEFAPVDVQVRCGDRTVGRVRFEGRSGWTCSDAGTACAGEGTTIAFASRAARKRANGFYFDLVVIQENGREATLTPGPSPASRERGCRRPG